MIVYCCIIISLIILFYYLFIASKYRNVIKIESTIDKKYYMVSNRYKNKQEASNTMYKVNEFIKKFMSFMYTLPNVLKK